MIIFINGKETYYSVDEMGNVFNEKYRRYIKPFTNNVGYKIVRLRLDGLTIPKLVHRLVAESFIINPNNKKQVNHKNRNKNDNSVGNLEWVTMQENIDHAVKSGRYGRPKKVV